MVTINKIRLQKTTFNNIFIVESRKFWANVRDEVNSDTDLVLTLDFGLKNELLNEGYSIEFLDHLVDKEILNPLNFDLHNFLNNWYKDVNGKDVLEYKKYNLGDSLLLYIVNDATFFCHFLFNILGIKSIQFQKLFVLTNDSIIFQCLDFANIQFEKLTSPAVSSKPVYFFPLMQWIVERTGNKSLKYRFKNFFAKRIDFINDVIDFACNKKKSFIFIQNYYPTSSLIDYLSKDNSMGLILQNYTGIKKVFSQRRVVAAEKKVNREHIQKLKRNFVNDRCQHWSYDNIEVSNLLYIQIEKVIDNYIEEAICATDFIEKYFAHRKLKLMVPITNYWITNRLLMNYCRNNNIPIFMIINGLLNVSFIHDGKDSDFVNCYSETIKKEYFKDATNALPLGDPRMDKYASIERKVIDRVNPKIIIGAAGFDSLDLNSYLAYEFDFLFDILSCIKKMKNNDFNSSVLLKVRTNGYESLYKSFIEEYFDDLNIEIVQNVSFFDVICRADLYISIFSQTIFEASCFGIPSIYYKKDTQSIHKPFDNNSELVTANNVHELESCIEQFYGNSPIFNSFLQKDTLEKYIGKLDGRNKNRNIKFIKDLVDRTNSR